MEVRILLDTNAYSLLRQGNRQVAELVQASEEVLLSVVALGELMYGFRRGSQFERNSSEFGAFLDSPYVSLVPVGQETADCYSRIATDLRAKGQPIPTNDIWIAAHAMETGADLLSADRHFERIDSISWMRVQVR